MRTDMDAPYSLEVGNAPRVPVQYLAGERAERETELIHEAETEPRGEFIMDYLGSMLRNGNKRRWRSTLF